MSQENFQLAYGGEGVVARSIDVYVLAPALLSLGELVKSANEVLNGDTATTSLRVESDFRQGSFEVSLILSHTITESAKGLFSGNQNAEAAALFTAIFGAVKVTGKALQGLIKVYKALKGEKPTTAVTDQSTHTTILVMGDGNEIHVEDNSARLYMDDRTRNQMEQVIRPLGRNDFDSLEVKRNSEIVDRTEKRDLPARLIQSAVSEHEVAADSAVTSTREVLLKISKVNFESGKWTFSDGTSKFGATIEDQSFLSRVNQREEGFYAGDTLHVDLTTSQKLLPNNKIELKHSIVRVIRHIHSPRSVALPFRSSEAPQLTEGE